jgi:hypothetical protein
MRQLTLHYIGTCVRVVAEYHKIVGVRDVTAAVGYLNTVSHYNVAPKKEHLPAYTQYLKSLLVTFINLFPCIARDISCRSEDPIRFALF